MKATQWFWMCRIECIASQIRFDVWFVWPNCQNTHTYTHASSLWLCEYRIQTRKKSSPYVRCLTESEAYHVFKLLLLLLSSLSPVVYINQNRYLNATAATVASNHEIRHAMRVKKEKKGKKTSTHIEKRVNKRESADILKHRQTNTMIFYCFSARAATRLTERPIHANLLLFCIRQKKEIRWVRESESRVVCDRMKNLHCKQNRFLASLSHTTQQFTPPLIAFVFTGNWNVLALFRRLFVTMHTRHEHLLWYSSDFSRSFASQPANNSHRLRNQTE